VLVFASAARKLAADFIGNGAEAAGPSAAY